MDINALRKILKEGDTVNGAYLSVDHNQWNAFMREVKDTPARLVRYGQTRPTGRLSGDYR